MAVTIGTGDEALNFTANLNLESFRQQAAQLHSILQGQTNQITSAVSQQSTQIEGLAKKASLAIGTYLSFQAAGNFISDIVTVRGQFQALSVAFETMLGSKQKADKLMAEAVQLAAVTPFTLQEVGSGAKQLLAYGFAADTVTKNLETLGNIASGVGAPLNDIVYLYGTLKATGRATQVDLQQFAGRGIPIYEALAKVLKVTSTESQSAASKIREMATAGKIGFADVEKAFQGLTSAGGQFYNLMQEQSKTLTGQISNLQDAWSRMLNDIGQKNDGVFTSALSGAISVVDNYKKVVDLLELIVIGYGSYRAAVALTTLAQTGLTAAEILHYGALELVRKSQIAFNAALAASPVAAFTLVLSALAAVVVGLNSTIDAAVESQKNLVNIQAAGAKAVDQEKAKTQQLLSVLKDQTATREQQVNALKKLREVTGDHLKAYTDEEVLSGRAKNGIDQYIKSIESLSIAKAANAKIDLLRGDLVDLKVKGIDAIGTFDQLGQSIKSFAGAGDYSKVGYIDQLLYGGKADEAFVTTRKQAIEKQIADIGKTYKKEINDALKAELTGGDSRSSKALASSLKGIEDLITKKKEEQALNSTNRAEYLRYEAEINKLEAQATAIRGANKAQQKAQNDSLQEKKKILEDIANLQRDSQQSGLLNEQSEVDQVNQAYEKLFATIAAYNKANPKNKIGQSAINGLANAQQNQVSNLSAKEQAEQYRQAIEAQRQYFDDFVQYQKDQLGDKAEEVYQTQLHGFKTYVDYLKAELAKLDGRSDIGSEIKRIFLAKSITDQENKNREDNYQQQIESYKDLIQATQTFYQQKLAINKKYNDLEATLAKQTTLKPEDQETKTKLLEDQRQQELTDLEDNNAAQSELYKTLNANIIRYTKDQLNERLALLKKYLKDGFIIEKDGSKTFLTPKTKADLEAGIAQGDGLTDSFTRTFDILKKIGELGDVFSSLGDTLGSGLLSDAGSAIAGIASQLGNLQTALKFKGKDDPQQQDSAISGASNLIDIVVSSAAKRKQAAKDYYLSVIGQQNEYNLSLNDQIRLQNELNKNVFINDYKAKILDGIKASQDALDNYQKALKLLSNGQVKTGQRNAVDFGAVGKGAASGAAVGALVGPIGAAIGAVVGGVIGLFAGKKKKDIYDALLTQYPQLIQKAADGTEKFNEVLAKSLITNNLVDDSTKQILNNIIDWSKKLEEARAQIKSVVSDLAGSLGDDLRNSLVDAFKNGTDAAIAFGESVNKTLENIISNMLFNEVFGKSFDELQKRMEASFDLGGDNNFVDDVTAFFKQVPDLAKQFDTALAAANKESQKVGLNVFGKATNAASQQNGLQGSIQAQLTEQTGSLIAGQFGALRLTALDHLNVSRSSLQVLNAIQANTAYILSVDRSLIDLKMNGIKIKP